MSRGSEDFLGEGSGKKFPFSFIFYGIAAVGVCVVLDLVGIRIALCSIFPKFCI